MTLLFSDALRAAHLEVVEEAPGPSPRLVFYAGAPPARADDPDPAQPLATLGLPADWMGGVTNGTKTKLGTWEGYASDSGVVRSFRVKDSTGNVCYMQGTVTDTSANGDMRMNNQSIRTGQKIRVSAFVFQPWPTDPVPFPVLYAQVDNVQLAVTLSSQAVVQAPPGVGIPNSVDFLSKAGDPRGGDCAYVCFPRTYDGKGFGWSGFSHDRTGRNSVVTYDPVGNTWTQEKAHKTWSDDSYLDNGAPPWDARGVAPWVAGERFMGNRDNQVMLSVDQEVWCFNGQRGQTVYGNYRGIWNAQSKEWVWIDDGQATDITKYADWPRVAPGTHKTSEGYEMEMQNAASGYVPALDLWYIFGGRWLGMAGNPSDGLVIYERNTGAYPYKVRGYFNRWGNPAFTGSVGVWQGTTDGTFARGSYIFVYGGYVDTWAGSLTGNDKLYRIDPMTLPPTMTLVSTNNLPANKLTGPCFVYYDSTHDFMVATNGVIVNVYDFAGDDWYNVPVNTPYDIDRASPGLSGAPRQSFYAPERDQLIILGGHAKVYGMQLNYGGVAPTQRFGSVDAALALTVGQINAVVGSSTPRSATVDASLVIGTGITATSGAPGTLALTTTTYPLNGPAASFGAGAGSKHLHFSRIGNRWYKVCGDHVKITSDSWDTQGGRQEIISVRPSANDWTLEQQFWVRDSAQIQLHQPDDGWSMAVRDEIWVVVTNRNPDPVTGYQQSTARAVGAHADPKYDSIMAWNPTTKIWREVIKYNVQDQVGANPGGEYRSGSSWFASFDQVRQQLVIPCYRSGTKIYQMSTNPLTEGKDVSRRNSSGILFNVVSTSYALATAIDPVTSYLYLFEWWKGELYQFDIANNWARTLLATFPWETRSPSLESRIPMIWHDGLRALVIGGNEWTLYEVDTGRISHFPREDYFVETLTAKKIYTSICFYDPETNAVWSVGGMSWDGATQAPDIWYKQTFTRV